MLTFSQPNESLKCNVLLNILQAIARDYRKDESFYLLLLLETEQK